MPHLANECRRCISLKQRLQTQCHTAKILVIAVSYGMPVPILSLQLFTEHPKQEKIICGTSFMCSKVCITGLSIKHLFAIFRPYCSPLQTSISSYILHADRVAVLHDPAPSQIYSWANLWTSVNLVIEVLSDVVSVPIL